MMPFSRRLSGNDRPVLLFFSDFQAGFIIDLFEYIKGGVPYEGHIGGAVFCSQAHEIIVKDDIHYRVQPVFHAPFPDFNKIIHHPAITPHRISKSTSSNGYIPSTTDASHQALKNNSEYSNPSWLSPFESTNESHPGQFRNPRAGKFQAIAVA